MAEMSPVARILLYILQRGAWITAALLVLFASIVLWQSWTPAGFVLEKDDARFLGVLAVLFLIAVYLVRGIGKELKSSQRAKDRGDGT